MKNVLDPALILGLLAAFAASPAVATPPGMGACCVEGLCHVDSAADCAADGGLYLGDGTNCGGVSCACEEELADSPVFPGDGQEHGPVLSYTDNGDETVTDNVTRLVWEIKTGTAVDPLDACVGDGGDDLHAVNGTCTWEQATGAWIDALNTEGGTGYANHTDWRLPSVKELQSIVDYGTWPPAIDASFPGAEPADWQYWTATYRHGHAGQAWLVSFYAGEQYVLPTDIPLRVRAVRGGR